MITEFGNIGDRPVKTGILTDMTNKHSFNNQVNNYKERDNLSWTLAANKKEDIL